MTTTPPPTTTTTTKKIIEKILIHDDFFTPEEHNTIKEYIGKKTWKFGHKSKYKNEYETPFWSIDIDNEEYFTVYLKQKIERFYGRRYEINRIYMNGQTYGQDATFHIDSDNPEDYTFCYYVNNVEPEYKDISAGELIFKIPHQKYHLAVPTLNNRGVLFPSHYEHKATAYGRYIMDLRVCIAWKFREIKNQ